MIVTLTVRDLITLILTPPTLTSVNTYLHGFRYIPKDCLCGHWTKLLGLGDIVYDSTDNAPRVLCTDWDSAG